MHCAKKQTRLKRSDIIRFLLCKIFIDKFIDRMGIGSYQGSGNGRTGRNRLIGTESHPGMLKMFWDKIVVAVAQHCERIN